MAKIYNLSIKNGARRGMGTAARIIISGKKVVDPEFHGKKCDAPQHHVDQNIVNEDAGTLKHD